MSPSQPNRQRDINQATRRLIREIFCFTAFISFLTIMGSSYFFGEPTTRVEVAAILLFSLLSSWLCVDNDLAKGALYLSRDQKYWKEARRV